MGNPKGLIWTVIGGTSALVGWQALTRGIDPIPQWAGIATAGVILLFLAEPMPKLASGFAVLIGISFALTWEPNNQTRRNNDD